MMKATVWLTGLVVAVLTASASFAGAENGNPATPPSTDWNGVWQDVKDDWKQIGNSAKETGEAIGQAIKKEAQEAPENMRRGYEEAKRDVHRLTGANSEESSEK